MIIDSFMFFNEFDILEKRLEYLYDYVDKFVLVESTETHTGNKKPLYFFENKERYEKWSSKITHVIAKKCDEYDHSDKFAIEKFQREHILNGIVDSQETDILIISDVDEIPNRDLLRMIKPTTSFHMVMFEYSFDYIFEGELWVGSVLTSVKDARQYGTNYFRFNRWRFPIVKEGGWHLSSFGNASHVRTKILNYAHANDDKHKNQDVQDYENFIKLGIHSDGKTKLRPRPDTVIIPEQLMYTSQSSRSHQTP